VKRLVVCAAALVICGAATQASGQDEDFGRSGFYLGGSLYRASDRFEDEVEDELDDVLGSGDVEVDSVNAVGAVLGLRLGSRFALELIGERYRESEIDLSELGVTAPLELRLWTAMLQGKLYLFTGRLQPYLMAGVGVLRGETEVSGAGLDEDAVAPLGRLGAGIEIYLTRSLVVNLQGAYSRGFGADLGSFGSELDELGFYTFGGSVILRF
jgi:opacity protein-like surface antigen